MADHEHGEPLIAQKLPGSFLLPAEVYEDMMDTLLSTTIIGGTRLTDEERAEMQRAHEARLADVQADYQRTREACTGQPAALAALDVHHPIDNYGIVCDLSESDEWSTDWPCSTYEAIKGAVG
jgi:hypothetical protein